MNMYIDSIYRESLCYDIALDESCNQGMDLIMNLEKPLNPSEIYKIG